MKNCKSIILKISEHIENEAFGTEEMKEKFLKLTVESWKPEELERVPQKGTSEFPNKEELKYKKQEKKEKTKEEEQGIELLNNLINNVLYYNTNRDRLPTFQEFCPSQEQSNLEHVIMRLVAWYLPKGGVIQREDDVGQVFGFHDLLGLKIADMK
ncbi:uncharacterized protein A4U43_C03F1330 [Asparagus officinalis]|uniref:Uncharacterized protein n=1 Tax=Asparagus officinalis TaxID=4686 RepID=A0A5P1F978_ASPOF|nr:uncharacterized protein A4U43_C03F1330 [Asparagus officinalis]